MKNRFSNFNDRPSENNNLKIAKTLKDVSQNLATIAGIIQTKVEDAKAFGEHYNYAQDTVVMKLITETQKLALEQGIIFALPIEDLVQEPADSAIEEMEDEWDHSGCSSYDEWSHSSC